MRADAEIELNGSTLSIEALSRIVGGARVAPAPGAMEAMAAARTVIDQAVAERRPVYGVTTGLGPSVVHALDGDELERFALTTVRGRAHGVGEDLPEAVCRAALAVRLNTLLIGAAGARPALAATLTEMLNAGLSPAIRAVGSIGAADLMQGGDFGAAVIGEGRIWRAGEITPAREALSAAAIAPYAPGPREGLALVSHSSISAALAATGVARAETALQAMQQAAALSMEGFRANLSILDPDLLALRPQSGQTRIAEELSDMLRGSALWTPGEARRLQDPLSIRNVPQIHGALRAALDHARDAAEAEINGASDNPGVVAARGEVASHGGYLTPHLMIALSGLSLALAQAAACQAARIQKMVTGRFTDLPNGLTSAGAAGAGLSPVMKTVEALAAEIAREAAAPPIYPGVSADGLEDVAVHANLVGKALLRALDHQRRLSAIELIVAAQAVEVRGAPIAPYLEAIRARIRLDSPRFEADRPLGDEIEAVAARL